MICKKIILLAFALFAVLNISAQQMVVSGSFSSHIDVFVLKPNKELKRYVLLEGSQCNSVDMTPYDDVLFSYSNWQGYAPAGESAVQII